MTLTWIEVVDSIVKIGLGSIITAVSGYLVMKSNQKNQDIKEKKDRFYKVQDEKAEIYVKFLSQSHQLVQTYLSTCCKCNTEEYFTYLNTYSKVQIFSSDEIRKGAFSVFNAVNVFIVSNKNLDNNLTIEMRDNVNSSIAYFQFIAHQETTKKFNV